MVFNSLQYLVFFPIVFALLMIVSMEFVPFLLIFMIPFAALGFWASRGGKASAIVLGVALAIGTVVTAAHAARATPRAGTQSRSSLRVPHRRRPR